MPRGLRVAGTVIGGLLCALLLLSDDIGVGAKLLLCLLVVGYRLNVLAEQIEKARADLSQATAQLRSQIERQQDRDDLHG